jgi:hypothetical protein
MMEVREFAFNSCIEERTLQELGEYKPDFSLFFRGEFVSRESLSRIPGIKVAFSSEPFPRMLEGKLVYTVDSIGRYRVFSRIRETPFDYVFHYDEASQPVFESDGLYLSGSFPFPVATKTYTDRKDVQKTWDLFFIGRSTPYREAYFGDLKRYFTFLHICHGISGTGLVNYINASRICLNIHAENEVSWEPRVQMLLAAGAFVISERLTPNRYLRPGVDYVEVPEPAKLFPLVKYYLEHPEESARIARSGFERVREVLDSRKAFQRLFEGISRQEFPRFSATRQSRIRALQWKLLRARARVRSVI